MQLHGGKEGWVVQVPGTEVDVDDQLLCRASWGSLCPRNRPQYFHTHWPWWTAWECILKFLPTQVMSPLSHVTLSHVKPPLFIYFSALKHKDWTKSKILAYRELSPVINTKTVITIFHLQPVSFLWFKYSALFMRWPLIGIVSRRLHSSNKEFLNIWFSNIFLNFDVNLMSAWVKSFPSMSKNVRHLLLQTHLLPFQFLYASSNFQQ